MNHKTSGLFIVALALALPSVAHAGDKSNSAAPSQPSTGVYQGPGGQTAPVEHANPPDHAAPEHAQQGRTDGNAPSSIHRGGGPETPPPAGAERTRMLHAASPHIVAVETQLQAARDTSQGIERLASLAGNEFTPEYGRDMTALTSTLRTNIESAQRHLEHLRASAQNLGMMDRLGDDFTQADHALTQAHDGLGRINVQEEHGAAGVDVAGLRTQARDVSNQLGTARSAVQRIERAMR